MSTPSFPQSRIMRGWFAIVLAAGASCVDLAPPAQVTARGARDGMASDTSVPDGDVLRDVPRTSGSPGGDPGAGRSGGAGVDAAAGELDGAGAGGSGGMASPTGGAAGSPDATLLVNGQACIAGTACASGFCADGVCCNSGCAGLCESCVESSAPGTCSPVAAGTDPASECAQDAASTCKQDGYCDGARACRLHAAGTGCSPGSCSNGTEVLARSCNGQGVCLAGETHACAPNLCGPSACATTCATAADCSAGAACIGTACVNASGLQLYWNLDEASGAQALDSSGLGRNGTFGGAQSATPTATILVPTLKFANPRSRAFATVNRTEVRLRNVPGALLPANDVTLSVWYRATAVNDSSGVGELISLADGFAVGLSADAVEFWKRGDNSYVSCAYRSNSSLDGNWHHLAGVSSSSGGMLLYFDGLQRDSNASVASAVYDATTDLVVGADLNASFGGYFGGNVDEVRLYNRVLSAAEIAALAAGGR